MSGIFGCLAHSTEECLEYVFYGTDYHTHLGSANAGIAFKLYNGGFFRQIHNIENGAQFKHIFAQDFEAIATKARKSAKVIKLGIGIISDRDPQPLCYCTKFGDLAIATVGRIPNLNELAQELRNESPLSLREEGKINIAEVVVALITSQNDLVEGIEYMWSKIQGSISLVLLLNNRMIGVRDKYGISSLALGRAQNGIRAFASEVSSFYNLGFTSHRFLKPGEIVEITESAEKVLVGGCQSNCRACAFNWIYTGSPASSYEEIQVEPVRYRCGSALAKRDGGQYDIDMVAGIPDSGTGHAIGYANESGHKYGRPFIKYTPTWSRSYTPDVQVLRNFIARMKLFPVRDLISNKSLLFCEDSIVRGTQLVQRNEVLRENGVKSIHIRPACPPLLWPCPYLRSTRTYEELIARRAILDLGGFMPEDVSAYLDSQSQEYKKMVAWICKKIGADSLAFLQLSDMVEAIGLPIDSLCTYCWTGIPIK